MKHLIRLSFKYIRRQKLRTFLTFSCIMLATFLMASFGAFFGSLQKSAIQYFCDTEGSGEVIVTDLLAKSPKENALEILQNHAVVDDYYVDGYHYNSIQFERNEDGTFGFETLQINGGNPIRLYGSEQSYSSGNPYVGNGKNQHIKTTDFIPKGSIVAPDWMEQQGYHVGDTVTFTINTCTAKIDLSPEQKQKVIRYLQEESENSQAFNCISDGDEYPRENNTTEFHRVNERNLLNVLSEIYDLETLSFTDESVINTVSFSAVIHGFFSGVMFRSPRVVNESQHCFSIQTNAAEGKLLPQCPWNAYGDDVPDVIIAVTDNIELEDALAMLMDDMGFDSKRQYYDFFEQDKFNGELLGFKLKGTNAIMFALPYIIILLIVLLIVWAVSRFIVDNAFEISVQERSSQFAALRIMGAAKKQLFTLIQVEALFYCVTAVPLGAGIAVLGCKMIINGLVDAGLDMFIFYIHPLALTLSIVLALIGVWISSYTSAMWAARKLSPLEALQYGKPQKARKNSHKAKEKLRKTKKFHSQKAFLRFYTMQNIRRTGKRFVVSTISMLLSTLLFSIIFLSMFTAKNEWSHYQSKDSSSRVDYLLQENQLHSADFQLAQELFADSEKVAYQFHATVYSDYNKKTARSNGAILQTFVEHLYPNSEASEGGYYLAVVFIDKSQYEQLMQPVTGMTYEQFSASGAAIFNAHSNKFPEEQSQPIEFDALGHPIYHTEYYYESSRYFPAPTNTTVQFHENQLPILGVTYINTPVLEGGVLYLPMECVNEYMDDNGFQYIYLTVNNHIYQKDVKALTEKFLSECEGEYTFEDFYWSMTGFQTFIDSIFRICMLFLICIWLVGILSMMNAVNTSVLNRQRELIMMRAVGMTVKQLYQNVFLESILFTAGATICGTLIGVTAYVFVAKWMVQKMILESSVSLIVVIGTALGILCINLLLSLVAAIPAVQSLSHRLQSSYRAA